MNRLQFATNGIDNNHRGNGTFPIAITIAI